jgi:hypothetical protein
MAKKSTKSALKLTNSAPKLKADITWAISRAHERQPGLRVKNEGLSCRIYHIIVDSKHFVRNYCAVSEQPVRPVRRNPVER